MMKKGKKRIKIWNLIHWKLILSSWLVSVPCPSSVCGSKAKGPQGFSTFSYSDSLISYNPLSSNHL
jgi:hypothetical protein